MNQASTYAGLTATLQKWQEALAEKFFDLDDAGDARQFADAMHTFLPSIIAALTQKAPAPHGSCSACGCPNKADGCCLRESCYNSE